MQLRATHASNKQMQQSKSICSQSRIALMLRAYNKAEQNKTLAERKRLKVQYLPCRLTKELGMAMRMREMQIFTHLFAYIVNNMRQYARCAIGKYWRRTILRKNVTL